MTEFKFYDRRACVDFLKEEAQTVCSNCKFFKSVQCRKFPDTLDPEFDDAYPYWRPFWQKLGVCDAWTPNERADEALQLLTMRKLETGIK